MSAAVAQHVSDVAPPIPAAEAELPAVLAANLDLLNEVPEGSAAPSAADHKEWAAAITQMGAIGNKADDRRRVADWNQFAMVVLAYEHAQDKNFTHAFGTDPGLFKKPISKQPFACAASALYRLNVNDAANSKRVNSKATQYKGLLLVLREQGIRTEELPLSRDSVRQLTAAIERAGGLDALERKKDASDEVAEPIQLDSDRKDAILLSRAKAALAVDGDAEPELQFVLVRADGKQQVLQVPSHVTDAALVSQAPTPARTQALAELLEMGGCVLPAPTTEPKNKTHDPNDSRTEMRDDERQVVFYPDGRIVVSLLKAGNSTVVMECRNHDLHIILGEAVQGHARMYTQKRKTFEVDILPRNRRTVFDVAVVATDKKTGVGRLQISSDAATGDRQTADVLLQRLSGEGYYEVAEDRLDLRANCSVAPRAFRAFASAYLEKADKAVRSASKPRAGVAVVMPATKIRWAADGLGAQCSKCDEDEKTVAGKTEGTGTVSLRLDDFAAFLRVYLNVSADVTSEITCNLGDRVVVWGFCTTSGSYRVLIPQANDEGARKDAFIKPLERKDWPKNAALQPS